MSKLIWDATGERRYETGVSKGVIYFPDETGEYTDGTAWNGLTAVNQAPSGAEPTKLYADNINYVTLTSLEEFAATIEAYTYPEEFGVCDGTASPIPGVAIGQQARQLFGFSYQTIVGNDVKGNDFGHKTHLIYGCKAAPSAKDYASVNDSPEAATFSWELSTNPVYVNELLKPTAIITLDSTILPAAKLQAVETILYGQDATTDPVAPAVVARMPLPAEVLTLLAG